LDKLAISLDRFSLCSAPNSNRGRSTVPFDAVLDQLKSGIAAVDRRLKRLVLRSVEGYYFAVRIKEVLTMSTQGIRNAAYRIRNLNTIEEKLDALSGAFIQLAEALAAIDRDIQTLKRR